MVITLAGLVVTTAVFAPVISFRTEPAPEVHAQNPVSSNVSKNPDDAPNLSDIFPDRDDGPHQNYRDEESCLICHRQRMDIPGMGNAPQMPHEERFNCISCHLLPEA